jgi:hypothetical protein
MNEMIDFELPESKSLESALQNRIEVLESKLAAINGAALVAIENQADPAEVLAQVAYIRLESQPDGAPVELSKEDKEYLERLEAVTK